MLRRMCQSLVETAWNCGIRHSTTAPVAITCTTRSVHVSSVHCRNLKAIRRDYARRQTMAQYEKERLLLRCIKRNNILPEVVQDKASTDMRNQPRNASIGRVRNRCVQTGRGRGIVTAFGHNRMKFRRLADFGMLAGITRSSW